MMAAETVLGKDRHCLNFNRAFRAGKIGPPKGPLTRIPVCQYLCETPGTESVVRAWQSRPAVPPPQKESKAMIEGWENMSSGQRQEAFLAKWVSGEGIEFAGDGAKAAYQYRAGLIGMP